MSCTTTAPARYSSLIRSLNLSSCISASFLPAPVLPGISSTTLTFRNTPSPSSEQINEDAAPISASKRAERAQSLRSLSVRAHRSNVFSATATSLARARSLAHRSVTEAPQNEIPSSTHGAASRSLGLSRTGYFAKTVESAPRLTNVKAPLDPSRRYQSWYLCGNQSLGAAHRRRDAVSFIESARRHDGSTPSTRRCLRDRVGSMVGGSTPSTRRCLRDRAGSTA